jgi:hypothetical protein
MSPTDLSFISFIVLIIRRTKQVIYLVKLKAIDKIRSEISKPYILLHPYSAVRSRPRFKSQC